jgi:glycosyltransferase involved in cell wall biosynthesis
MIYTPQILINLALLSRKPTGLTTYALNLIPRLTGLETTLLVPGETLSYLDFGGQQRVAVPNNLNSDHGVKGHLRRLWWTQYQLPKFYQRYRAEVLFSPIPEAPIANLWQSQCYTVVTVHDLIPLRFGSSRSPIALYWRYYVPQVLAHAHRIICNSQTTAQDILMFYGKSHRIDENKIISIPLAYDAQHFRYLARPTQPCFVHIGRHNPHKNVQRVVQAFAQFVQTADTSVPWQLWLVGPTDQRYTPDLQRLIQELGILPQVKFLDYVPYDDLPKILNQATALVFPSLWEGFGFPVLEAMACGTPVITSNLSSLPEVAGDAGLLVDPYDVGAIATAMQTLAHDASLWATLRQKGLAQAQTFSWQKTADLTKAVLQA